MNKRQKKKKLKNEAWNEDYQAYLRHQRELERELGFNGEGYRDRTAEAAIRSVMREQGYR